MQQELLNLSRTKFLLTLGMMRGKGEITTFEQEDLLAEYNALHGTEATRGGDVVQQELPPLKEVGAIKVVKLDSPFWSAGTKYGWTAEFQDLVGFGVKATDLKENTDLLIDVGPQAKYGKYSVNTEHARQIVKEYNAFQRVTGGTILAVIPREICKKLY